MFSVVSRIKQMLSADAWPGVKGGDSRVFTLPGREPLPLPQVRSGLRLPLLYFQVAESCMAKLSSSGHTPRTDTSYPATG